MDANPSESRGSREYIRWAVEESLRRLRTDVIDVYQMHEADPSTPAEETLGALDELVREGKVRWIGSSNFSPAQVEEADTIARDRGLTRFVAAQNEYSLIHRGAEDELLPLCDGLGVGVLPYFPLASGLLTGKHTPGRTPTEGRLAGREIPAERWAQVEAHCSSTRTSAASRFLDVADRRALGDAGDHVGDRGRDEAGAGGRECGGRELGTEAERSRGAPRLAVRRTTSGSVRELFPRVRGEPRGAQAVPHPEKLSEEVEALPAGYDFVLVAGCGRLRRRCGDSTRMRAR